MTREAWRPFDKRLKPMDGLPARLGWGPRGLPSQTRAGVRSCCQLGLAVCRWIGLAILLAGSWSARGFEYEAEGDLVRVFSGLVDPNSNRWDEAFSVAV